VYTYGFTQQNLKRIAGLPQVAEAVPVRAYPQEIRHQAKLNIGLAAGTTAGFADLNRLRLLQGRFLTDDDNAARRNVAVISDMAALQLFGNVDPLGQVIVMSGQAFVVVGVFEEPEPGERHAALVPLQTFDARFGDRIVIRSKGRRSMEAVPITEVQVKPAPGMDAIETAAALREMLYDTRPQRDWKVEIERP
jgi:putative ABC transport system permease protein